MITETEAPIVEHGMIEAGPLLVEYDRPEKPYRDISVRLIDAYEGSDWSLSLTPYQARLLAEVLNHVTRRLF